MTEKMGPRNSSRDGAENQHEAIAPADRFINPAKLFDYQLPMGGMPSHKRDSDHRKQSTNDATIVPSSVTNSEHSASKTLSVKESSSQETLAKGRDGAKKTADYYAASPRAMQPRWTEGYSPAGPPGLGESEPGSWVQDRRLSAPLFGIDNRKVTADVTDRNGSRQITYDGELAKRGNNPDFHATEKISAHGKLLERHIAYRHPTPDITFITGNGPAAGFKIDNVSNIDTVFDSKAKVYRSIIRSDDGPVYSATTNSKGETMSFKRK